MLADFGMGTDEKYTPKMSIIKYFYMLEIANVLTVPYLTNSMNREYLITEIIYWY
jgi:hypothetical protein